MDNWKALSKRVQPYRYPLLVLILGIALLLLPSGSKSRAEAPSAESALEQALQTADGVGRVQVLVSENGAVVVCDGAENAAVRWNILRAIGSYTGFGSDRITVLKMTD